ncbi:DUF397 domain-containing protein [Streptomyces sp. WI04-05B]|uniref:DUF397 domain-containing protein n=1 Tax=Streptomyces TaxID=1883 RepID=UPI0029B4CE9B|nr:DUF397 domain-containing protein [Streptomyces sp. WI04-05A]MDX2544301.1 DUF397 domain-containing protein [Streptomyces sp. WI04-05B]MDX2588630.1 DUF397 domain-containing protein [Streptomyces sp. WI04-05A]MDX3750443.1 DUF397 domain-containing protein [Streptomyces sp. AK08-02]
MAADRGAVVWRKSSYSANPEPNCCEVAVLPGTVRVRDSKRPGSVPVSFTADAWRAAIALFLLPDSTGRDHV